MFWNQGVIVAVKRIMIRTRTFHFEMKHLIFTLEQISLICMRRFEMLLRLICLCDFFFFSSPLGFVRTQTPATMWTMATRIPSHATHSSTTTGRAQPDESLPLLSLVLPRSLQTVAFAAVPAIFSLLVDTFSSCCHPCCLLSACSSHKKKNTLAQLIEGQRRWGLFCPRFFPRWFHSI